MRQRKITRYGLLENAFFNNSSSSSKIGNTRYSQYFFSLGKRYTFNLCCRTIRTCGMVNLAKTNPKWLGMAMEGYVFAGLVFWVICYAMSRYSQNLERKLSTER